MLRYSGSACSSRLGNGSLRKLVRPAGEDGVDGEDGTVVAVEVEKAVKWLLVAALKEKTDFCDEAAVD